MINKLSGSPVNTVVSLAHKKKMLTAFSKELPPSENGLKGARRRDIHSRGGQHTMKGQHRLLRER